MSDFKVYLAPMEGLADAPMRKVLCRHGGYDLCFSEFIRVSSHPVLERTLLREVPEYENDCKTADGTQVRVQFLGDEPEVLAKSAAIAARLGAKSIDLNFGCPSRFVHHAGAMLLKEPELMHRIVSEVRQALDPQVKLSVKVRLGFMDKSEAPIIIDAVSVDGVDEIIVHCRTRKDLYRSEALDWSALKPLYGYSHGIALVANGNINSLEDALNCSAITGTNLMMTGRGAFAVPNLGKNIKLAEKAYGLDGIYLTALEVLEEFALTGRTGKIVMDRTKQFLGYARMYRPELGDFFKTFCRCINPSEGSRLLQEAALKETARSSAVS